MTPPFLPFIRGVGAHEDPRGPRWALETPAVAHLLERRWLDLSHPITVITGDNGVGKSTLLSAVARAYGFNQEGGALGDRLPGPPGPLSQAVWVAQPTRPKQGYFLRADAHFDQATRLGGDAPGGVHLHSMSHGESVLAVVDALIPDGLYLFDEPESGLSAVRQMALLAKLHALAGRGAQIIAVTHSPILVAIPGANVVEITPQRMSVGVAPGETVALRAMQDWLDDPAGVAQYMIEVTRA